MVQILELRTPEELIRNFWELLPQPHARKVVAEQSIVLIERESGILMRGAHREVVRHEVDQRLALALKNEREPVEFMLEVIEMAFGYCE